MPNQVAARVNDVEISLHQVNQALENTKNVSVDTLPSKRREILEKLICQQLAIDEASKEGLDHTPEVMSAIESSRREIISTFYLTKISSSTEPPTDSEIKKYYEDHPELFSKRKLFIFQDFSFDDPSIPGEEALQKLRSREAIEAWLGSHHVGYSRTLYSRFSEQVPSDLLARLTSEDRLQTILWHAPKEWHLIWLENSYPDSQSLEEATPSITDYFLNTKGATMVDNNIRTLRKSAKIEYKGEFAHSSE